MAQSGLTVLNTVAVLILTPVVACYLLLDWEGMVKGIDDLLPREHRREIRQVLDQIDHSIAGVFRGQGGVILVLCVYYATALTLTGLNFGLVIGLMTGLLSFIPFFGFLTGFVLSMGIALVQFAPNWWFVAIVFIVYMIGQFLEGNVLYPRLVGQSININPVWLMFALFAFAFLFGFVGLLLAVPLSAITATLTRYAIRRYKESALYRGERPTREPARPETPNWRWRRRRTGQARRRAPQARRPRNDRRSADRRPVALRLRARAVASRRRLHRGRRQSAGAGAYPRLSRLAWSADADRGSGQVRKVASGPHMGRTRRGDARRRRTTSETLSADGRRRGRWCSMTSSGAVMPKRRCSTL